MDDYSRSSTNLGSKIRTGMEKCPRAFDILDGRRHTHKPEEDTRHWGKHQTALCMEIPTSLHITAGHVSSKYAGNLSCLT
jgi:hypothetical protein